MMEERGVLLRRILLFLLLCLLTAGALSVQGGILSAAARELPNAAAFRAAEGLQIPFSALAETRPPEGNAYSMAGLKHTWASSILAASELEEIDLLLTDDSYPEAVPLEFAYGNYFVTSPVPEENRSIVISDRLAVRFFLTDNAVGKELMVDGLECQVCGVYRSRESLLSRASSDGRETIYLGYPAVPGIPAQILYVRGGNTLFLDSVSDGIADAFGYPAGWETATSYPDLQVLAEQCRRATLFLCGAAVVCLLAVLLAGQARRAASALTGERRREALRPGIAGLLCAAGIVLLLICVCYHPDIPPRYLPSDNIFDLRFYVNNAVEAIQARNRSAIYDYYWNLSQNILLWGALWGAVSVSLFLLTFFYAIGRVRAYLRLRGV